MTDTRDLECADVLRRVSAYIDEELDAEVCHGIEAHCATCGDCRHVVESLKDTIGLCRATGQRPLPARVREKAQASIQALLARAKHRPA